MKGIVNVVRGSVVGRRISWSAASQLAAEHCRPHVSVGQHANIPTMRRTSFGDWIDDGHHSKILEHLAILWEYRDFCIELD